MPAQPKPGEEAAPPAIDLSEDVFAEEAAAPEASAEVEAEAAEPADEADAEPEASAD
jgi:hypothetical protein